MKQFNKTVLAVALLAAAGSASAFTSNSLTGTNEAYLVAFDKGYVNTDSSLGRTYNLDLGVTFNGLKSAGGGWVSLLTKDLTGDANYTTFLTGATESNISWGIYAAGDTIAVGGANNGIFVTGTTLTSGFAAPAPRTTPAGSLTTWGTQITSINQHGVEITAGLTGTSSVIKATDAGSTGQADSTPTFDALWGGSLENPTLAFNTSGNFYYGGTHTGTYQQRVGGAITQGAVLLAQSDIVTLGSVKLTPAGLTAVPLPAAVWMFGAGLMGLLRLNRRKAA